MSARLREKIEVHLLLADLALELGDFRSPRQLERRVRRRRGPGWRGGQISRLRTAFPIEAVTPSPDRPPAFVKQLALDLQFVRDRRNPFSSSSRRTTPALNRSKIRASLVVT